MLRGSCSIIAALYFLLIPSASVAQNIPEPKDILGFEVGADYHLASYQQAMEYFQALEQASPRIKLFEIGKTTMDRPMIYAVISSEANMANLDRIKEIAKKMSLVEGLTDEEAQALAREGKAVVYIDGGLHATECAPAQQNILLAYNMVASEDPEIQFIRDKTVLVLVFANPDGMDLLAEWYHPNIGTPFETARMPWLYHKYVGHDNNRDSYMLNMIETKHLTKIVNEEWFPVVLLQPTPNGSFPHENLDPPGLGADEPECAPHVDPVAELTGLGHGI